MFFLVDSSYESGPNATLYVTCSCNLLLFTKFSNLYLIKGTQLDTVLPVNCSGFFNLYTFPKFILLFVIRVCSLLFLYVGHLLLFTKFSNLCLLKGTQLDTVLPVNCSGFFNLSEFPKFILLFVTRVCSLLFLSKFKSRGVVLCPFLTSSHFRTVSFLWFSHEQNILLGE